MRKLGLSIPSRAEYGAEGRIFPRAGHYVAALACVALATAIGLGAQAFVPISSVALFYVLAVIIAAISFGWWPSLVASVASALTFDFFFTQPIYSLRVATAGEFWAIILLFLIASTVSALAAQSRSRALRAARMAAQAEALQALAHTVILGAPRAQIIERAASTLSQAFGAPAFVLGKADQLTVLASSGRPVAMRPEDLDAARTALDVQGPTRGGQYPTDRARLDFWPAQLPNGEQFVIGIDFTRIRDGRPDNADGVVESVAACLAAAR